MAYPGLTEVFLFDDFGLVTGSYLSIQFPTGSCGNLRFKADPGNAGVFLLGDYDAAGGSMATGGGYPMDAGDDTGFFYTTKLNRYYYSHRTTGTLDYLYWWLQK